MLALFVNAVILIAPPPVAGRQQVVLSMPLPFAVIPLCSSFEVFFG